MAGPRTYRPGQAVGGDYSITGTLPTLADVIAFKEGTAEFDHGYYRFVSHPRLRELEETLKSRFHFRHCRLTESFEIALLELLICLHPPGSRTRIVILKQKDAAPPFTDTAFLPACEREGLSLVYTEDPGKDDAVIAVLRAEVGRLPEPLPAAPSVKFYVLRLGTARDAEQGGAVLSNAERVMARLAEQVKRRGPILSARCADYLLGNRSEEHTSE